MQLEIVRHKPPARNQASERASSLISYLAGCDCERTSTRVRSGHVSEGHCTASCICYQTSISLSLRHQLGRQVLARCCRNVTSLLLVLDSRVAIEEDARPPHLENKAKRRSWSPAGPCTVLHCSCSLCRQAKAHACVAGA